MRTFREVIVAAIGVAVFIGAVSASVGQTPSDSNPDQPTKGWRSGPVSYVLTKDEDKSFKACKSDEERARAIAAFWERRDPTPETPRNEYKEDFYNRINLADKIYSEGAGGWMSARGRALIILGRPSHVSYASWGELWAYTRTFPPGNGKWAGKKVTVEVGFVRERTDRQGMAPTYRMSDEGLALLGTVAKLDPLEAAKLSLTPSDSK